MPTGLVILILNRYIPESPRFLSNAGLESQARAVLRKFSGSASTIEHDDPEHPGAPALDDPHVVKGMRALLRGRHASITWGLGVRSEEHTSELQSLMRISYAVICLQK